MKYFYLLFVIFILAGCGGAPQANSPAEAYRQYHAAVQRQDVAAVKQTFSKKTLEGIDAFSKKLKRSTDETLAQIIKSYKERAPETPEYKDEKIDGDSGTLEVKSSGEKWSTFKFIKEDGGWKIVLEGLEKL